MNELWGSAVGTSFIEIVEKEDFWYENCFN